MDGHHGGFVVSKCLEPYMTQQRKLSDRVGYADFAIPSVDNTKNLFDIRFIIVYGPTTPSVQKGVHLLDKFYDTICCAQVTKMCRMQVYVVGDINSKVGGKPEPCTGNFAKGKRNDKPLWIGQIRNNFCSQAHVSDIL